jgi:hypothetical protein
MQRRRGVGRRPRPVPHDSGVRVRDAPRATQGSVQLRRGVRRRRYLLRQEPEAHHVRSGCRLRQGQGDALPARERRHPDAREMPRAPGKPATTGRSGSRAPATRAPTGATTSPATARRESRSTCR